MAPQRIPDWLYDLVARDAQFQCGYCRCPQQVLPYRLEIEHLLPTSLGGSHDRENLWLSCHRCNKLRSNRLTFSDPLTGEEVPAFHPRKDNWSDHFLWEQDGLLIVGGTACGRATVAALNLNDSSSKFVADAASVRQQMSAMVYADAGSVGHVDANLELLNDGFQLSARAVWIIARAYPPVTTDH